MDRNPAAGRAPGRACDFLHAVAAGLDERLLLHRHAERIRRALCALGAFLGAYDGYDDLDRWITNIAGFCAVGVAFCPTKPTVCVPGAHACPASSVAQLSIGQQVVGDIHVFFAITTFVMLGLMALRFANGGGGRRAIPRGENSVYRASGITILCCVMLAVLSNLLPASVNAHWPLLFIFEAVAVFSFGVSWFVKGRTMEGIRNRIRSR